MVHSWWIWSTSRNLRWIPLLGRLLLDQELYLETLPSVCMTLGGAQLLMAPVPKWALEVGNILISWFNLLITLLRPGHATIGGLGPTSRQWGSMLDHIREVEVVLANGTIARANENQNSDLYFVCDHDVTLLVIFIFSSQAIRGAGASYGIVTEFVFITHPEPGSTVHYSYNFTSVTFILHSRRLSNLILSSPDWGVLKTWLRPLPNGNPSSLTPILTANFLRL